MEVEGGPTSFSGLLHLFFPALSPFPTSFGATKQCRLAFLPSLTEPSEISHSHKSLSFAQTSFLSCSAPIMVSQGKGPNCIWEKVPLELQEEGLAKLFKGRPC